MSRKLVYCAFVYSLTGFFIPVNVMASESVFNSTDTNQLEISQHTLTYSDVIGSITSIDRLPRSKSPLPVQNGIIEDCEDNCSVDAMIINNSQFDANNELCFENPETFSVNFSGNIASGILATVFIFEQKGSTIGISPDPDFISTNDSQERIGLGYSTVFILTKENDNRACLPRTLTNTKDKITKRYTFELSRFGASLRMDQRRPILPIRIIGSFGNLIFRKERSQEQIRFAQRLTGAQPGGRIGFLPLAFRSDANSSIGWINRFSEREQNTTDGTLGRIGQWLFGSKSNSSIKIYIHTKPSGSQLIVNGKTSKYYTNNHYSVRIRSLSNTTVRKLSGDINIENCKEGPIISTAELTLYC